MLGGSPLRDERGFSSIETTIILAAFVTLSAIFGFAVLETGIPSSERSRETVQRGLDTTTGTLTICSPVVGAANVDNTAIDAVRFELTNAAHGSDGVELSGSTAVVTYFDDVQVIHLESSDWTATWLTGFGSLVNPGECVQISVDLQGLDPRLGPSTEFAIELSPAVGTVVRISKKTPGELAPFVDLP